jgi:hypothetical protein
MMYAGDEVYDDDVTSDGPRCIACDGLIEDGDHSDSVCDECSGLVHCIDDICHGQGYCMHVKDAWRP